jgi:probable rRNA maturation factor
MTNPDSSVSDFYLLAGSRQHQQEAKQHGKTLASHYAHLLVHGTLHAQGWDHETSLKDAHAMEAREVTILAGLGLPNPYR